MQNRKTALVTGATGAIGASIARKIAEKGYKTIIVARNKNKAERVVNEIMKATGNDATSYEIADLSLENEIADLSRRINEPIDVLVNDAAVTPKHREETENGIEMQWATNVLGYFWMMKYFTPHLQEIAPSRVVNVASYWAGDLDLQDPEFKQRTYDNDTAYRQSKQADRMLSVAFANLLQDKNIAVNACHPGDVRSNLSNNLGYGGFESSDKGAETPAWLATESVGLKTSGGYFEHKSQSQDRFAHQQKEIDRLFALCESY